MTGRLAEEARLALLAVQFLTRLPVPADPGYTPERMARAIRYFPLVGFWLGVVLAGVYGLSELVFPPVVAALLAVTAGVLLTGALYEDGLADLSDGLGGWLTRERALEIMRDSRIGSYGTLALGLVLALKVAALAGLGGAVAAAALVAAHTLSRVATVVMTVRLPYARKEGKAGFARTGPGHDGMRMVWGTGVVALVALWLAAGLGATVTALIAASTLYIRLEAMLRRRLGGRTGDTLGALQQLCETAILVAVLAWA